MENRIPILRHVYIYTNVICFLGLLVSSSINNFLKTNSHNFYFFIFSHKNVRVQDQEVLSFIIQGLLKYLPTHYSHYIIQYNSIFCFSEGRSDKENKRQGSLSSSQSISHSSDREELEIHQKDTLQVPGAHCRTLVRAASTSELNRYIGYLDTGYKY